MGALLGRAWAESKVGLLGMATIIDSDDVQPQILLFRKA